MSKKEKILLAIVIAVTILIIAINECHNKSVLESKEKGKVVEIKTEMDKR